MKSGIGNDSVRGLPQAERECIPLPGDARSGIGHDSVIASDSVVLHDDRIHRGRMKRLPVEFYRSLAFVHWNMAMDQRRTGWLTPLFHQQFREVQLHALCRYRLLCLVYCLMPDHLHLLWAGLAPDSDQDRAAVFFRKYLNRVLATVDGTVTRADGTLTRSAPARSGIGHDSVPSISLQTQRRSGIGDDSVIASASVRSYCLQKQAWDVVLREKDRERHAVEELLSYITENPVRAGLVNNACDWPYTGAQAPAYPNLEWRADDFTERLWKVYLLETECKGVPLPCDTRSGIGHDSASVISQQAAADGTLTRADGTLTRSAPEPAAPRNPHHETPT